MWTLLCFVKSFFEDSEGLAGDVAFEAAADFSFGFAFGGAAFDVGFGGWIMALSAEDDGVDGLVEVSIAGAVEAVSGLLSSAGGRDWGGA